MYRLFKRQRRRLNLFAAFAALPFAMLIFVSSWPALGLAAALSAALAAGLLFATIPLFTLRFAPQYRFLCEGIVIGVIVGSAFHLITLPLADVPVIGPWRAVIGIGAFALFYYFDVLNRILPARDYTGTACFRSSRSSYTLWAEHAPDPGLLDRHWSEALHNLVMKRSNPLIRIATFQTSAGEMRQRQQMTEETTHASFAYDFTQLLDDGSDGTTGSYALSIADHGAYRDVTIDHCVHNLPIMSWLATWLDDIVGDECDHHTARGLDEPDFSITGHSLRDTPHRLVGPSMPEALAT